MAEARPGRLPARARTGTPPTETWNKWGRWGTFDFHSHSNPKPICYAVAFDPDGWKRVSNDLVREAGVQPAAALLVLPADR